MNAYINFPARIAALQKALADNGIDALVGTRLKTITHVSGAYVPWRSAVVVPAEGTPHLFTVGMDATRVTEEGWLKTVSGYSRRSLMEVVVAHLEQLGLNGGRIGIEDGYSYYLPEGMITHMEYQQLQNGCPKAELVNCTPIVDRLMLIKEPEQIELMRQATAMCDAAQEAVRLQVRPGMTEVQVAGIAEKVLRDCGSEFAWTFTGGQEIASGHRTWTGACTPSTRKIIQPGDMLLVDLHGMYDLMLGDVSHNGVMGKPTDAQKRVIEAYVETCHYLLSALKPGRTIGDVAREVREFVVERGWGRIIRGFGHGIGHFGNEWFPSFTDIEIPYVSDPDIVLEPGFMEIMAVTCNEPGVGGLRYERPVVITETGAECLSQTPIEPWVYGE